MKLNIKSDRYYFGVYANMARHNVFMILSDIARKTSQPEIENEDARLKKVVIDVAAGIKTQQRKSIELLHEHFPFLQALNEKNILDAAHPDAANYNRVMHIFCTTLSNIRNYHTHAHHKEIQIDPQIFDWMKLIFDDGIKKAKERFDWDEEVVKHLRRWTVVMRNGRKEKTESPLFRHRFTDDNISLTEKGVTFFICLFLEKDYIFKFLGSLCEGRDTSFTPATLEVYSIYRCLMPRHKLKSDNRKEAVLLDMLNELQRCPKELYHTLGEADKKKFIKREASAGEDVPDSILLRKESRFPYFALRCLENMNSFTKFDFQLDLGKYVFHTYETRISETDSYIRRWDKPIHVFGKLADIEANYPETLSKVKIDPAGITDATEAPYLIETNPHYFFDGKNIGLKIKSPSTQLLNNFRPRISPKTGAEIHIPQNSKPDFVLCTDELHGVLFYELLAKKINVDITAQDLILAFGTSFHNFLNDVIAGNITPVAPVTITNQYREDGKVKKEFEAEYTDRKRRLAELLKNYGLQPHMVPEKLCRYLMGVTSVSAQERAHAVLTAIKEETETKLEEFVPKADHFLLDLENERIRPEAFMKVTSQFQYKEENKKRTEQLDATLSQYGLSSDIIPEDLCKYLIGLDVVSDREVSDAIQEMMATYNVETSRKGEILVKNNKKMESRRARTAHLRAGDRASFLADDMMYFQPHSTPQDGPNSDKFQRLQAALALFAGSKVFVEQVFKECGLIGSTNPHPFLGKIDISKCRSNLDFYKKYLQCRLDYISKCLVKNEQSATYANSIKFLDLKKQVNDHAALVSLANVLKNGNKNENGSENPRPPINLPRGLFKDAIVALIKEHGDEQMKMIANSPKVNTVFLLRAWFAAHDDSSQAFYDFKRNYRLVDEWLDKRTTDKELTEPIKEHRHTIAELNTIAREIEKSKRLRKDGKLYHKVYQDVVLENEKLIRHFAACDQVLFMACQELIGGEVIDETLKDALKGTFYLKDIMPDNEKSILNTDIYYVLPVHGRHVADTVKIKDFGNFRRFVKDRRLQTLLTYFTEDPIRRIQLRWQLDQYETNRIFIFKAIYEFEAACGSNENFLALIEEKKTHPGWVAYIDLMDKYTETFSLEDEQRERLRKIRNAFSHNQFPDRSAIEHILDNNTPFIQQIALFASIEYGKFTERLKLKQVQVV